MITYSTKGTCSKQIIFDIDDENRALLHFEIRKEREKLNPEQWLKKK